MQIIKMLAIFAVVLLSCHVGVIQGNPGENFDCYPNQTIRFTNPNSSLYTHYKAFYDNAGTDTDCVISVDGSNSNAYFDCASTTATVTLYISDRNLTSDNILSRNSETYTFRCMPVPTENRTLTNTLNVNISETAESNIPEFNITSDFYDYSSAIVTAATVGDTVYYIIKGPCLNHGDKVSVKDNRTKDRALMVGCPAALRNAGTKSEYNLKPLQCNATGTQANEHSTLIVDGCSQDTDLIEDFAESTEGLENHYNASLYVFKFYNSDTLTISCMVEVCTSTGDCSFSCGSGRRKRYVTLTSEFKREVAGDPKTSTVGRTLRILDVSFGGSAPIYSSMKSFSLVFILLYTLF